MVSNKNNMNNVSLGNVCPRCGKERVVTRIYKVKTSSGYAHYKATSCSDPECQKVVQSKLNQEAIKRGDIKKEQARREAERQKNIGRKKNEDSD